MEGPKGALFHDNMLLMPLQIHSATITTLKNQRTIGPVNAHLISWPSKTQNIQNLENIW